MWKLARICLAFITILPICGYSVWYPYECEYFPQKNTILINIPKNASSSMRVGILEKRIRVDYNLLSKEEKTNCKKFLIVRNPFHRVVSSYFEECKLRTDKTNSNVENEPFIHHRSDLLLSFKDYVDYIEKGFIDLHSYPQYLALSAKNLSLDDFDLIMSVETLEEDYPYLKKLFRLRTNPLLKENSSQDEVRDALYELIENDLEINEKIRRIYKLDFEFYENALMKRKEILSRFKRS